MDKYERRRLRLMRLKDEECWGSVAGLARRLGKTDSYVHRMLYEDGRKGKKRIGEDSVDMVKAEFGVDLDEQQAVRAPAPAGRRRLQWVDDYEADLLTHARATDDVGRATLMANAEELPQVLFDELAGHKPKGGA